MRTTKAAVAVLVVALAGCAAAPRPTSTPVRSASPTPALTPALTPSTAPTPPPPSPSPPTATLVTSERFGYTVEMPAGWRYRAATTDWPVRTYPTAGATYTDSFGPLGAFFPAFDVSTQQLPDDQAPSEFLAELDAGNASNGYMVVEDGQIVVDGVTGRLQRQTLGTESIWEVILFDEGRVYAIYWVGLESQREVDEPVFRHMMDTFAFPIGG